MNSNWRMLELKRPFIVVESFVDLLFLQQKTPQFFIEFILLFNLHYCACLYVQLFWFLKNQFEYYKQYFRSVALSVDLRCESKVRTKDASFVISFICKANMRTMIQSHAALRSIIFPCSLWAATNAVCVSRTKQSQFLSQKSIYLSLLTPIPLINNLFNMITRWDMMVIYRESFWMSNTPHVIIFIIKFVWHLKHLN